MGVKCRVMKDDIVEKPREHLSDDIETECKVVYLLCEIRKPMENFGPAPSGLTFYRHSTLHVDFTRPSTTRVSVLLLVAMIVCAACKEAQSGYALNRAGELYEQGKFEEAVQRYREAIQANPEFGAAHCGLGNALRKLDRVDEAIPSYQKSVELEPAYVRCRYPLAILLFERGRYDEAGREFSTLWEQDSNICESKVYLAVIAEARGRIVDAKNLFSSVDPQCISRVPRAAAAYERVKKP
jgi:tetratricopeptide (TPR) repeat protein